MLVSPIVWTPGPHTSVGLAREVIALGVTTLSGALFGGRDEAWRSGR